MLISNNWITNFGSSLIQNKCYLLKNIVFTAYPKRVWYGIMECYKMSFRHRHLILVDQIRHHMCWYYQRFLLCHALKSLQFGAVTTSWFTTLYNAPMHTLILVAYGHWNCVKTLWLLWYYRNIWEKNIAKMFVYNSTKPLLNYFFSFNLIRLTAV